MLPEKVYNIILQMKDSFNLNDILQIVKKKKALPRSYKKHDFKKELRNHPILYYDAVKDIFIPHCVYFNNIRFRITLQPEEREKKILIPGHRFMPFSNPFILPSSCKLISYSDEPVKKKNVKEKLKNLFIYHSFFPETDIIYYLLKDIQEDDNIMEMVLANNEDVFEKSIDTEVFDLQSLLSENDELCPAEFILTVKDWHKGVFKIRPATVEDAAASEQMEQWVKLMDKSLLSIFEDKGVPTAVYNQLAEAFIIGGKGLIENPCISIAKFLEVSKQIKFYHYLEQAVLWYYDKNPEESLNLSDYTPEISDQPATSSLELILQDIGISIGEIEIEAFMRDMLYRKRTDLYELITWLFKGCDEDQFNSEEQIFAFRRELQKLWKTVKKNYNRERDLPVAEMRSALLKMITDNMMWLRNLDKRRVDPEDLPGAEMLNLNKGEVLITNLLELLNREEGELSKTERNSFEGMIEELKIQQDKIRKMIEEDLEQKKRGSIKTVDKKQLEIPAGYQLKINLAGIEPQIWRQIIVPGDVTFEELHYILQIVMGWENSHLHEFICGRKRYCDNEELINKSIDTYSEDRFTLGEVLGISKRKFNYIYDFEDEWMHIIKVEKIIRKSDTDIFPVCIDGARACAFEDCGGPNGYMQLYRILSNPEHEEYEDFMEDYGDFSPEDFEEFSCDEVNSLLEEFYK